jgi:hypothetical protein
MVLECKYCKNKFSTKSNLNSHQKTAKYCLQIQGKTIKNTIVECEDCNKKLSSLKKLREHKNICHLYRERIIEEKIKEKYETKLVCKDKYILNLKKQLKQKNRAIKDLQDKLENVAIKAVSRPSYTSNKNIQINNYIKNLQPLGIDHIKESIPMLTLDHHVKGAEGYAEYALEFPFKDRIVCVDVARNKIKYKNEEGDIIEDPGFRKMMLKLCEALKDRTFKLCQEHYEKLAPRFSEEEMDSYDFMEAAKAIHKYANGRESDFCSKIIRLISKGSKVN